MLGAAPTGSGKTLAFCVPVIDWLLKHASEEQGEKKRYEKPSIRVISKEELKAEVEKCIAKILGF